MINAGILDKRLDLQEPVITRSASGEELITWTTRHTVWAAIQPAKGREYFAKDQIRDDLDVLVRIRASSLTATLTAKWRGVHAGTAYNFAHVQDWMTRGEHLDIPCRAGANAG
jgi:SPP1 family predicted phage head-tail adaptor